MILFNNTARKPFIIADTNALTHQGGFCPFPINARVICANATTVLLC